MALPKPGCGCGSLGCLAAGLVIGALAVWLAIPRLTREGYTPDKAAERVDGEIERISEFTDKQADNVRQGTRKARDLKDKIIEPSGTPVAIPREPAIEILK